MASSSTKHQYYLPGECDPSSSIVHHQHGIYKADLSPRPKQQPENIFIFTSRIYQPQENDCIIGIVLVRTPDLFLVDINSTEPAILPLTSFDRGCLPSRQAMNRFSAVYGRIVRTDPWAQIELSCQTYDYSRKKSHFGVFEHGYILRCSLELCKKIQQSQLIGHFNRIVQGFHVIIARNGFLWYTTDTINSMIAVRNVIYKFEFENDIDRLLEYYKSLITKLEQQEDNLMKLKQPHQEIKIDVEAKQIDP